MPQTEVHKRTIFGEVAPLLKIRQLHAWSIFKQKCLALEGAGVESNDSKRCSAYARPSLVSSQDVPPAQNRKHIQYEHGGE